MDKIRREVNIKLGVEILDDDDEEDNTILDYDSSDEEQISLLWYDYLYIFVTLHIYL